MLGPWAESERPGRCRGSEKFGSGVPRLGFRVDVGSVGGGSEA